MLGSLNCTQSPTATHHEPDAVDNVVRMHPFLAASQPVAKAMGARVVGLDDTQPGDIPLVVEGELIGGFRLGGLHGALDRLVEQVERELGKPVTALDRTGKQGVVHRLDQLGAFTLRKAVEDVADRLEISRFTVYNYLNAQHS